MRESRKPSNKKELSGDQPPPRRGWAGSGGSDALFHARQTLARAGFDDPTLVIRWAEIAGEGVARLATPIRFQDGINGAVLTLRCETAASVFLQHETRTLLSRINAYLGPGRVARLRLVPGTVTQTASAPTAIRPPLGPKPANLAEALERLGRMRKPAD